MNKTSTAKLTLCSNNDNGRLVDQPVMISHRQIIMEVLTALAILPFLAALVVGAREAEDEQA